MSAFRRGLRPVFKDHLLHRARPQNFQELVGIVRDIDQRLAEKELEL